MLDNLRLNSPVSDYICLKMESLGQKRVQNYLASRKAWNLWGKVKVVLCFSHLSFQLREAFHQSTFWIEKPSRFNVLTIKTELIIKNNISVLNIKNAGNFGKNEVCDVLHSLLLTDVWITRNACLGRFKYTVICKVNIHINRSLNILWPFVTILSYLLSVNMIIFLTLTICLKFYCDSIAEY